MNKSIITSFSFKDKRHRGVHSIACKCPFPIYIRPSHYKPLSKQHGRALRNLITRDKKTGKWIIRRRVSADPIFTFLRPYCNRKRAFKAVRRNLIDALFILFINKVDLATDIITINITKLAEELSPHDNEGQIIFKKAVTISRVSRLINELVKFCVISLPENNNQTWDVCNGYRFPKHVMLTETGWKLTGIDIEKLRSEQNERLRIMQEGIIQPEEFITLRAARKRWYKHCCYKAMLLRRNRSVEEKRRRKLEKLSFDERKRQIAEQIFKEFKEKIQHITPEEFEKIVWKKLYQLNLVELK